TCSTGNFDRLCKITFRKRQRPEMKGLGVAVGDVSPDNSVERLDKLRRASPWPRLKSSFQRPDPRRSTISTAPLARWNDGVAATNRFNSLGTEEGSRRNGWSDAAPRHTGLKRRC